MHYLTPEQVAERLAIEKTTVYVWLKQQKLHGLKLGNLWRVDERDVEALLESKKHTPKTQTTKEPTNITAEQLRSLPYEERSRLLRAMVANDKDYEVIEDSTAVWEDD